MAVLTMPDLKLETDPYVNNMFPDRFPRLSVYKLDYIKAEEEYQSKLDACARMGLIEDLSTIKEKHKCTWGRKRIERFIFRYVSIYRKKHFPDRAYFLDMIEREAKENNITLPTPNEMSEHKTSRKLSCTLVDINTENRVGTYKYYMDGSQVVAYIPGENKAIDREKHDRTKWDDLFDRIYPLIKSQYEEKNKTKEQKQLIRDKIESDLMRQFYEIYEYDDQLENETCPMFIGRKISNMSSAYGERLKRFRRKRDQTLWTAWLTITYDDSKFADERQFRSKLLNKFRNLAVRKQWRIMGVFERGELNGRLHFHGFFYIPKGQELGELVNRSKWSDKEGCWHNYKANTMFLELFGDNEYEDISEALQLDVQAMSNYTTKMLHYMEKGGTVFYSRHIPTEFVGKFNSHDMLVCFEITMKRRIKRYIVCPSVLTRTETAIVRRMTVDEQRACDIGLLEEPEKQKAA